MGPEDPPRSKAAESPQYPCGPYSEPPPVSLRTSIPVSYAPARCGSARGASIYGRRSLGDSVRLAPVTVGVAQLVEHRFCKPKVRGSSPLASSPEARRTIARAHGVGRRYSRTIGETVKSLVFSEGCPSGQREQAVNLPASAYVGSKPSPSTRSSASSASDLIHQTRGSSSVGRASAFQAECRGFESHLPLEGQKGPRAPLTLGRFKSSLSSPCPHSSVGRARPW